MGVSHIDLIHELEPARVSQLVDLYAAEWWTASRTASDVAEMLRATDLVVALIDRSADRLVGFARVLTDFTYLAVVLDVIVAAEARQRGLGAMLMNAVVQHPRLAGVPNLELVCQPDVMPFYRRWGFTDQVGKSRLMRRTSDPRLVGSAAAEV